MIKPTFGEVDRSGQSQDPSPQSVFSVHTRSSHHTTLPAARSTWVLNPITHPAEQGRGARSQQET